ncbi:MAG: ROK family protein [Dysgonamonadaceae bacterium]|jgi:glucokinase|nr:ROK family protein [Dysgonamonadaceae bacterium]
MAAMGIDLGGTKIISALFDNDGAILCKTAHLLEKRSGAEVGRLVLQTIDELMSLSGQNVEILETIGICVPGIADSKTGLVWAPNIPGWEHYPLQKEIEDYIKNKWVKVRVASDRTCYILGETWKGVAKGAENAVFVAVGTGIGMGILVDGRILHGHADITGAAGWMALNMQYEADYPQYGCFESNASGNGIARCALRLIGEGKYKGSILHQYDPDCITAREVFDAYDAEDPLAGAVIDKAIQLWGMAAANMVSLLNPEIIVWGGGIFGPAVKFLPRIKAEACRWAQPIAVAQVEFVASQLGGDAGLYGAGKLGGVES